MQCVNSNRRWASKSRIGAYIRGEIKLEDIMHPSKIIKPKERHNRRLRLLSSDTDVCPPFLLNNDKIVIHKEIESKIRPYIKGLTSLKDLVHPSKLTTRVNIHPQTLPTLLEIGQGRNGRPRNTIVYDDCDSKMAASVHESQGDGRRTNFQKLFSIFESRVTGTDEAAIRDDDQQNGRYVTVVVSDRRDVGHAYAQDENRLLSLVAKIQNGDGADSTTKLELAVQRIAPIRDEYFPRSAKSLYPVRGAGTSNTTSLVAIELSQIADGLTYDTPNHFVRSGDIIPSRPSSETSETRTSQPATNYEQPAQELLLINLYQKIQTLLEQRVEALAYSQQQFEKMETLQKENHQLRKTITKIGEKLNDIEDGMDTFSTRRMNAGDQQSVANHEKLKTQNQCPLKTTGAVNSYLPDFESECGENGDERTRRRVGGDVDRYKRLYKKEVKNFKRHKRKCEALHRQLLQRCNQLHQKLQELDDQNLEMAAKLSYVPVKIQLACRQYQEIIKKLNDDLNNLRNLERKSKSSTFVHEKSYPKNYT